jgi:hypothetical protein
VSPAQLPEVLVEGPGIGQGYDDGLAGPARDHGVDDD